MEEDVVADCSSAGRVRPVTNWSKGSGYWWIADGSVIETALGSRRTASVMLEAWRRIVRLRSDFRTSAPA